MIIYSKNIYLPNQVKKEGYLIINKGIIDDIVDSVNTNDYIDYSDYLIIPGFIDQHLHGWGTGSFVSSRDEKQLYEMKKHLPKAGVTSFLATTGAEPIDELIKGINSVGNVMNNQKEGSTLLGIHLEGPFVNESNKGMMNVNNFLKPSVDVMKKLVDSQNVMNSIKLMTMAIELEGASEVIKYCNKNNIQISIGHSCATFETIKKLKELGVNGVTHMFSGMSGFHHRELGVAGSALYFDDLYCEFAKQTGITVKKEAFQIAYKLKGANRIIMTTDNAGISQIEKERYHYVRKQYFIPDGDKFIIRNEDVSEKVFDRTNYDDIKDLELSYIRSIQNLKNNVNPSVHDIIKMTSENSAKYIGVFDKKGSLEKGKDADILVVDKDFNLKVTYCMGRKCFEDV